MKFGRVAPEMRKLRTQRQEMDQYKWQVFFAWWPRRIDSATVVWLERAARRRMIRDTIHRKIIWRLRWVEDNYTYGPITHALMQPGVSENVIVGAVQQQSVASASFSAAQNSGAALQGGPVPIVGHLGQNVPSQGLANVGGPPPGGFNSPAAKPGP